MRLLILLVCLSILPAGARAEDGGTIGGRTQAEWRVEMAALEREAETAERDLAACEAREAPAAYDGVDAIITRDRRGRLRGVELTRCDEQRSELLELQSAIEDFEEAARRSEVPPGWLR